jgi:hypothetical protein
LEANHFTGLHGDHAHGVAGVRAGDSRRGWQTENKGLKVERFMPGRNDQVVLCRDPQKYPNFEFRNVGANGEIWTGVGTNARQHFPDLDTVPRADWPHENMPNACAAADSSTCTR